MRILKPALAVMVALLFVGGPDGQSTRLFQAIWDYGHVPLFAGACFLACRHPLARHLAPWKLAGLAMTATLCLGLGIEWLQLAVGRSFSHGDVAADLVGCATGLSLHLTRAGQSAAARRRNWALLALLLVAGLHRIILVLADEWIMRSQFPVLASFETPLEQSRWDTNLAQLSLSGEPVRDGRHSLRIEFEPGEFPDVSLMSFPGDWVGYRTLRFSLYSRQAAPVIVELKIYDHEHAASNYAHHDRFNRELLIQPGWNEVAVALEEVARAPRGRRLDLRAVASVSLFMDKLREPAVFHLDRMYLSAD